MSRVRGWIPVCLMLAPACDHDEPGEETLSAQTTTLRLEQPPASPSDTLADTPSGDPASTGLYSVRGPTGGGKEEGRVGRKEARLSRPSNQQENGIVGLLGSTGEQVGMGGLGTRGTGMGGGGSSGYGTAGALRSMEPTLADPRSGAGEGYRDAGVNALTLTSADHLSTFATDVDTGAFTLSRRLLLEEGRLPSPAGVRVEEFINYPDWEYPTPSDDSPVAVTLEAAPHPWQGGHHLLRVGLRGRDVSGDRPPATLVFLVDVSGSMSGEDRLPRARAALHTLVDSLGPADTVGLVTYAGNVGVRLAPTPCDKKARIHAAIDTLTSGGGTSMGAGIDLAYDLASKARADHGETRVVVLSDGDANIGTRSPEGLLDQIQRYAGQGITLSTVGFGVGNYQDAMMEQFADKGDGAYYYIDSLDEAERVFTTNLAGTIQTVARDVKVQVDFDPRAVHAWRLVGYENRDVADRDFRNDKVDAGEMGSGQRVTVIYDVVLEHAPDGPLATVHFRAKTPGTEAPAREWLTTLDANRVRTTFEGASADFRAAVGMAGFAELLRHSPYAGELTFGQVERILADARRPGREDGDVEAMVKRARALWPASAGIAVSDRGGR